MAKKCKHCGDRCKENFCPDCEFVDVIFSPEATEYRRKVKIKDEEIKKQSKKIPLTR